MTVRLGILLSGRGSNYGALHDAIDAGALDATIAVVLSNVPGAPGLERARARGLETKVLGHRGLKRREHDRRMAEALKAQGVDWVCLAGYMRLLTPSLVDAFPERILNIHPSLLPAFPGLHAQRQAWDYGVRVSGCTVHLVDHGMDTGPIVAQRAVSVEGCETADDLAAKILREEHRLYPQAVARLAGSSWTVRGRRVHFEEKSGSGVDMGEGTS